MKYYTQNPDHRELNDVSIIEVNGNILTLGCNELECNYKVKGVPQKIEEIEQFMTRNGETEPINPEEPEEIIQFLGLELDE